MNPCLPPTIERVSGCIHIPGGECFRTLYVTAWPSEVTQGWLQSLYAMPVDISIHYLPIPNDVAADAISRQHDRHDEWLKGKSGQRASTHQRVAVESTVDATLEVVKDLVDNKTRMFKMGLYIRVRAATHDEADHIEKGIVSLCKGKTMPLHHEQIRLEEGYFQALPFAQDFLGAAHTLPAAFVATTFPFATGEAASDDGGVYFGDSVKTGAPIFVDRTPAVQTDIMNPHALYLGMSGAGKSYAMSLEIARTAATTDTEVNIVDVKGEYVGTTLSLGGTVITDPDDESQFPTKFGGIVCWVLDQSLRAMPRLEFLRTILERIWERCLKFPHQRKMVVVDEAWEMLRQDAESAFLVWRFGKEGRSHGIALTTGTQDVNDVDKGDKAGGENVLRNSRTKILLPCDSDAFDDLARVFRLSEGEVEFLDGAQQGEALLIRGRSRTAIKITGSAREHQIVSASLARRTQAVA